MKNSFYLTAAAYYWLTTATAADLPGVTFSSNECVDKAGFDTCYGTAIQTFDACSQQSCNSNDISLCEQACVCTAYFAQLNCVLEYCWNRVYSCDHQIMQIAAHENCGITDFTGFPYWRVPENAPGGCSCNLAFIYNGIFLSASKADSCVTQNSNAGLFSPDCSFCQLDSDVSAYYNSCPDTSPAFIDSIIGDTHTIPFAELQAYTASATTTYDCTSLSFLLPGFDSTASFLAPGTLPTTGTGTAVSDGSGSITSPISGATITWSFYTAIVATVTAASSTAGSGSEASSSSRESQGASSGSATATATGTSGGTATASASASASTKSLGSTFRHVNMWHVLSAILIVSIMLLLD